jgi:hypothetical protein
VNLCTFVKNNKMKKLGLALIALFISVSLSAQITGFDVIAFDIADITGIDTTLFPNVRKIKDCSGNTVRFTLMIRNTDAITDTFNIGGRDGEVSLLAGADHFETISSSALPFKIDTTAVAPASGGMTLVGDYYVKTYWVEKFPFKIPGAILTKTDLTQGDGYILFYNIED